MNEILSDKRMRILGWNTAPLLDSAHLLALMKLLTIENWKKAEETYKKFLVLVLLYPDEHPMVFISGAAYELWILHMIHNTYEYQNDCKAIFGYPLHHGKLPPEDPERRARVEKLWRNEFNEEMPT